MNQKRSRAVFQAMIYFVIIPLVLGALIYSVARDESIYFLQFFGLNFNKISLPYWIQYHLPDGLWAFAFSSLIAIIWWEVHSKGYYIWLAVLISISVALEVFYGTFDWIDLVFVLGGIALGWLFFKKRN